jgi:hypothetical protein
MRLMRRWLEVEVEVLTAREESANASILAPFLTVQMPRSTSRGIQGLENPI